MNCLAIMSLTGTELFREYNDKGSMADKNSDDMTECIALMRRGLEEFQDRVDFKTKACLCFT